jgi:hypothetical protein
VETAPSFPLRRRSWLGKSPRAAGCCWGRSRRSWRLAAASTSVPTPSPRSPSLRCSCRAGTSPINGGWMIRARSLNRRRSTAATAPGVDSTSPGFTMDNVVGFSATSLWPTQLSTSAVSRPGTVGTRPVRLRLGFGTKSPRLRLCEQHQPDHRLCGLVVYQYRARRADCGQYRLCRLVRLGRELRVFHGRLYGRFPHNLRSECV